VHIGGTQLDEERCGRRVARRVQRVRYACCGGQRAQKIISDDGDIQSGCPSQSGEVSPWVLLQKDPASVGR